MSVCGHQTCKGGGILRVAHIQKPRGKLGTYFQLQKTHGHQSGQGNDLLWKNPILKATRSFDHVTKVGSRHNKRNLYLHFRKTYGH